MQTRSSSPRGLLLTVLVALGCGPSPSPGASVDPGTGRAACEGADALTRVWAAPRRAALNDALEQLPGEWPAQVMATLDARLAERGESWARAFAGACERGELATMGCLMDQVWDLEAVASLIVEEPDRAADLWLEIDRSVADSGACQVRGAPNSPPPDAATGPWLARLRLLLELGAFEAVTELLVEPHADAVEVAIAEAVVAGLAGERDAAETGLTRAARLAESLGPRAQLAAHRGRAWVAAAHGDLEGATLAHERALAAAQAAADPRLAASQLGELGRSSIAARDPGRAIASLTEGVALASRLGGPDDPHTAALQIILADAQLALGQVEAAHDSLTQARDSLVVTLGPDHPQTLAAVEAIGRLLVAAGRPGDAQFAFLDLLEINTDLHGPKHWRTARIKLELGDSLMAVDQHDSARTLYAEALVPLFEAFGAQHRAVIRASIHLGIAELALGNWEAAQPHCARGRDLARGLAPGDPLIGEAEQCLAQLAARSKPRVRK